MGEQRRLVVVDMRSPEIDVRQLLYSLWNDRALRHVPVLMCERNLRALRFRSRDETVVMPQTPSEAKALLDDARQEPSAALTLAVIREDAEPDTTIGIPRRAFSHSSGPSLARY